MAGTPFGFGGSPFGPYSSLRRSVIDPVTGRALVTSEPTGEVAQRSTLLPVGRDDGGRLVPAVPGLAMQAMEAAKFPGQVYRGEASVFDPSSGHVSDDAVRKGFDLAGAAMTGSLPFAKPAGAIGMFGGRNAKTADLAALGKAEGLAAQGADRQAIWDQTGWFQGADQKWRFEIPDDASQIGKKALDGWFGDERINYPGNGAAGIGAALWHKPLYDAYPELRQIGVDVAPNGAKGAPLVPGRMSGAFHGDRITGVADTTSDLREMLLHEVQHPVQRREGFARGGSPNEFNQQKDAELARHALAFRQEMAALSSKGADSIAKANAVVQQYREIGAMDWLPSAEARQIALDTLGNPDDQLRSLVELYGLDTKIKPATGRELYQRLAGEVEARNVQTRRDMTPEQRRATPPWLTQDVADKDQIVRFGSAGPQMSLGDDFFASLESALAQGAKNVEPPPPGLTRVDPNAKSWDLYHGSQAGPDFKRFDPQANSNPAERGALFFGAEPDVGNFYAAGTGAGTEAGPRVFRTTVDPGKTGVFDLRDLAERDPTFNAEARAVITGQDPKHGGALFDDYMGRFEATAAGDRDVAAQLREMGLTPGDPTGVSFGYGHIPAAIKRAQAQGLDTAVLRGLAEHGGADQVVVLTPGRVRSRYGGDLLYGAAPVGLAAAGALVSSDDAQAAPSQGNPPVSASPFGFGPQMSPEDLARLFQAQAGAGAGSPPLSVQPAPFGFGASPMPLSIAPGDLAPGRMPGSVPVAMDEAETQALERVTGMVPPATARRAGGAPAARAQRPPMAPDGSVRVPLPPARPPEFGQVAQADMPAQGAQPIMAQGAAPQEGPSVLDRIMGGIRSSDGLLTSLGIGLMSTPGFGQGVAAGLSNHQQGEGRRAASRLAQAEYGLKARELAQKEGAQNQTKAFLVRGGHSPEAADGIMAAAAAGDRTALNNALNNIVPQNKDPSIVEVGGNKYRLGPNDQPSQANLLGPAGAPADTTTADQKNYEEARRGGYSGSFLDYQVLKANAGKAQTTINNAVNPVLKGLGDQFVEGAAGARASADAVRSVQNARSQLEAPGGIYAGAFAENQLALQKLGSFLGVADPAAIQNTETFRTQIKPIVLDTVKGLGAGSGVSNADRDFALQAVGGDIKLDEGTIRRVLDITERSARAKIERHNSLAAQMLETQPELKQIAPMLQVEMPQGAAPASGVTGAKRLRFDPSTGAFR